MGLLALVVKRWVPSIVAIPKPDETSRAFAIRAVAINGWPTFLGFYTRIGLNGRMLRDTRDSERMSEAFGIPAKEFDRFPDVWDKSTVVLVSERFGRRFIDLEQRRVCHHCVQEHGWSPLEWELKFITTCGRHGPLVSKCTCGKPLTWGDRHLLVCNSCAAPLAKSELPPAGTMNASAFQGYCLGRLGRGARVEVPLLDALELASVVDLAEALGALLDIGFANKVPGNASHEQRACWRDAGYLALAEPETFDLVNLAEEYRLKTGTVCPKRPADILGFFSDAKPLYDRGNELLVGLLLEKLAHGLGYPVHDLWVSDFVSIEWCAAAGRMPIPAYISALQEAGLRDKCMTYRDYFFVPVDIHWEVTHLNEQ
ncbi:TniQ family protein [Devosia sp. LjRoot3]|uniref:TniQ family protein n=1 Tax=Devosia sp. LjRoot3 TaxID=3342319 RepID=UPI003ECE5C24